MWVKSKEMRRQRREKKGNKVEERKDKKRHRNSKLWAWSGKGDGWCTGMFFYSKIKWKHSNFFNTVKVGLLHIIRHPVFMICVHQCPHKKQARPLDCSGAEVGASLATKSTAVQLQYTSRLTVANCPTQGCTIRRFCWDDQHDQIQV